MDHSGVLAPRPKSASCKTLSIAKVHPLQMYVYYFSFRHLNILPKTEEKEKGQFFQVTVIKGESSSVPIPRSSDLRVRSIALKLVILLSAQDLPRVCLSSSLSSAPTQLRNPPSRHATHHLHQHP